MKVDRVETELDTIFQEDLNQYYEVAEAYVNLAPEDIETAFELTKKAWVLADRWASLSVNASKLATMKVNKTDIKDFCYRKHKMMQSIHEHCRVIYRLGEEDLKRKKVGS